MAVHSVLFVAIAALQQAPAEPAAVPAVPREVVKDHLTAVATTLDRDIALLERIDAPLAKPLNFSDAPAGEVLDALRKVAKLPLEIDSRTVGDSGGWEVASVTCEANTVRQGLEAVVRAISPEYTQYAVDVAAGIIVITDEAGQKTLRATAEYPLSATLRRMGARDQEPATVELSRSQLEQFVMLTRPDAWVENGGSAGRIVWTGEVATIEATPGMHHDIRRRLAQLGEALPSENIQWTISVAEIADTADEPSVHAAIASRDGLEKLISSKAATMVSNPVVLARAGEPAEMKVGSDSGALEIRIEPTGSRSGRSFIVRVSRTVGGETREFMLRAVPGVRASAVLGGGKRLLVDVLGVGESTAGKLKSK